MPWPWLKPKKVWNKVVPPSNTKTFQRLRCHPPTSQRHRNAKVTVKTSQFSDLPSSAPKYHLSSTPPAFSMSLVRSTAAQHGTRVARCQRLLSARAQPCLAVSHRPSACTRSIQCSAQATQSKAALPALQPLDGERGMVGLSPSLGVGCWWPAAQPALHLTAML